MTKDFLARVEALARDLGVRIGRSAVERAELGQDRTAAASTDAPPARAGAAPKRPTPLPGLPGRRRRPGEPPPPCGHPGCGKPSRTRGYCQTHYVQWLKAGR